MQKKPYELNSFLNAYHSGFSSLLFYGLNRGLVSQRALNYAKLASQAFKTSLSDPLATIILQADEIEGNPQRLLDEIYTIGFFKQTKIIWLKNLHTHPNLSKLLAKLIETDLPAILLLIEAGELNKTNNLRKKAESSAYNMAVPCFNDDSASLNTLIDNMVQQYGLRIDSEAKQILTQQLGSDYLLSKSEIEKLCLYCLDKKQIQAADIKAIISDVSALNLTEIIDYILIGDLTRFNQHFEQYVKSGASPIAILATAMRQFSQLQALRYELEVTGQAAGQLIENLRPPVFYKRKKLLEAALHLWKLPSINRALTLLQEANLQCRLNNKSETIIAQALCLKLTQAAAHKMQS